MRVTQINLGRGKETAHVFKKYMGENKIDLALIQDGKHLERGDMYLQQRQESSLDHSERRG